MWCRPFVVRPRCLALAAFASAAWLAPADFVPDERPDLRQVFQERRCFPKERTPLYDFSQNRLWLLEANEWASHRLTTLIAAILLREHAGYGVDINLVPSGTGVYRRVAKEETIGPAAVELASIGTTFGYINLEVWPSGQRGAYFKWVGNKGIVQDMGDVGYDGRSGWFVSESFARNPRFPTSPEFYRAYDNATSKGKPVWATLLKNGTRVRCDKNVTCVGRAAAECPSNGITDLFWCPSQDGRVLPVVLASLPTIDQGFNEEIARSNNLQLGIHYTHVADFSVKADRALSSNNDIAQIVHAWKPSLFLTRIERRGHRPVRLMLPSEDCGQHALNGTGNWSCDFPSQALSKLSSSDILRDPIINGFFRSFAIQGTGMSQLLTKLAQRLPANDMSKIATSRDMFDTACEWILSNEVEGAAWSTWVHPRKVPIFADTMSSLYPYPLLLVMLGGSFAFIVFMEIPWLNTTFYPPNKNRILSRAEGRCRTQLEISLGGWGQPNKVCEEMQQAIVGKGEATPTKPGAQGTHRRFSQFHASPKKVKKQVAKAAPPPGLSSTYWMGMLDHAMEKPLAQSFWAEVEAWITTRKYSSDPPEEEVPPLRDFVSLANHTIPCFSKDGSVAIPVRRSLSGVQSGDELVVELIVEECIGGAIAGADFEAGTYKVHFDQGKEYSVVSVKLKGYDDLWQNSVWFKARLGKILKGNAMLATPDEATVLIFDEDRWPANMPENVPGYWGFTLMRYFIRADRLRRGHLWTKCMMAMCWLPVHPVLVSTLVQKFLVDHAVHSVLTASPSADVDWFYWECLVLGGVQLISLGCNRWADVVQARCRGRTGGMRQYYRGELLKKFMHMEHSEHWLASDASWLYSTIWDADVITMEAYWQVFVLAQSIVGLALSVFLVIILVFWTWLQTKHDSAKAHGPTFGSFGFVLGVLAIIPTGLIGVFTRRRLLWVGVIARKDKECAWFKSCTWIISNWRHLSGFSANERAAIYHRVDLQKKEFVPAHDQVRDILLDTSWIAYWLQGVAYSLMLVFGAFALLDYLKYGIGTMEVGTFYALCSIYLSVGKYVGILNGVFVSMQRAIVSLREISVLLNQPDQRSLRREAKLWAKIGRTVGRVGMTHEGVIRALQMPGGGNSIVFAEGMNFVRPPGNKIGSMFSEMKLNKQIAIPLGEIVFVSAHNERVLRSFLALAAGIIHPTTARGEELPFEGPSVSIPQGLQVMMLPPASLRVGATAPKIIEQLEFTGAPHDLCMALAESCGLNPEAHSGSLGPGSAQVFSIVRALLIDPDVLCAFRPLSIVPMDMRKHLGFLLRMWQGAGGLPALAVYLNTQVLTRSATNPEQIVWRPSKRTLIVGNPEVENWGGWATDKRIDLDKFLWKDEDEFEATPSRDPSDYFHALDEPLVVPVSTVGRGQEFFDVYGGS